MGQAQDLVGKSGVGLVGGVLHYSRFTKGVGPETESVERLWQILSEIAICTGRFRLIFARSICYNALHEQHKKMHCC